MCVYKKYNIRFIKNIFLILLIVIAVDIIGVKFYISHISTVLKKNSYYCPKHADVAVVLFSGFKDSQLNGETLRRLNETLKLFNRKIFNFIICSGGARPSEERFGSILMKEWLVKKGIKKSLIICETVSYDTKTNMFFSIKIARKKKWYKLLIISSPLQIYRIWKTIHIPKNISIYFHCYSYKNVTPPLDMKDYFGQTHHEWLAFIVARIFPEKIYTKIIKKWRS